DDLLEQARRGLDRGAVPEAAGLLELTGEVSGRCDVAGGLRDRLRALLHLRQAGPERRQHALVEIEVEIPRFEVLADVREVHVRAAVEVAGANVDEAERLVVGDQSGTQSGL